MKTINSGKKREYKSLSGALYCPENKVTVCGATIDFIVSHVKTSVGFYSTQGSGSNTPATQLVTLLYSRKPLLYSLLHSETHFSTQEVAVVTKISS